MKSLATFGFSIGAIFSQSLFFKIFWGWFICPFGLPRISMAWAVGLLCFAVFTTRRIEIKNADDDNDRLIQSIIRFLLPLFAFPVAWIAHIFM